MIPQEHTDFIGFFLQKFAVLSKPLFVYTLGVLVNYIDLSIFSEVSIDYNIKVFELLQKILSVLCFLISLILLIQKIRHKNDGTLS